MIVAGNGLMDGVGSVLLNSRSSGKICSGHQKPPIFLAVAFCAQLLAVDYVFEAFCIDCGTGAKPRCLLVLWQRQA